MYSVYPNLVKKLDELSITFQTLAGILSMSEDELSLKLQGKTEWGLLDVVRLCSLLNTSDTSCLFCTVRY